MSCRGVHFSLSEEEVQHFRGLQDESKRVEHLHEVIEEKYFAEYPQRLAESDKTWDAMHRALADGELTWEGGEYSLNHVVLGGELLYTRDDFVMVLKTPQQVCDVAAALPTVSREGFRQRYDAIDVDSYGCLLTDEDFDYTWEWFQNVREFWLRAAQEGRSVLFTVDQ